MEVGEDSQQMCPWLHLIGKSVTKPMSYAAALHTVRNSNYVHNYYSPYAYYSLDKGEAYECLAETARLVIRGANWARRAPRWRQTPPPPCASLAPTPPPPPLRLVSAKPPPPPRVPR